MLHTGWHQSSKFWKQQRKTPDTLPSLVQIKHSGRSKRITRAFTVKKEMWEYVLADEEDGWPKPSNVMWHALQVQCFLWSSNKIISMIWRNVFPVLSNLSINPSLSETFFLFCITGDGTWLYVVTLNLRSQSTFILYRLPLYNHEKIDILLLLLFVVVCLFVCLLWRSFNCYGFCLFVF